VLRDVEYVLRDGGCMLRDVGCMCYVMEDVYVT